MTFKETLRKLEQALRGLKPDQGRVARRNARRKVSFALLAVRRAVDASFPSIEKEKPASEGPGRRHQRLSHQEKLRRIVERKRKLRLRGFVQMESAGWITPLALAGVRFIKFKDADDYTRFWAPEWACKMVKAEVSPGYIARYKKDLDGRKAWLAQHALASMEVTP